MAEIFNDFFAKTVENLNNKGYNIDHGRLMCTARIICEGEFYKKKGFIVLLLKRL